MKFIYSLLFAIGLLFSGTFIAFAAGCNPFVVATGGTGWCNFQAHTVLLGNGTTKLSTTSPSTAGFVLTSNGVNADPTFQTISGVITALGSGFATTTGTQITFSTSTVTFNGLTLGMNITVPNGSDLLFTPNISGTLSVAGGGTGTTSPSGILYGDNGATTHLNTVTIGTGCTFSGGVLSCPGTGGSPSAPNTSIQFNNSGSFGGSSALLWDNTNQILNIGPSASNTNDNLPDGTTAGIVFPTATNYPAGFVAIQVQNATTSGDDGTEMDIRAGFGSTTGSGGPLFLLGGNGGNTGSGGGVTVQGGDAGSGGGNGGSFNISGGEGFGSGHHGGSFALLAGDGIGGASSGSVVLISGIQSIPPLNAGDIGFLANTNQYKFGNSNNTNFGILDFSSISGSDKTFTIPNVSGTFVLGTGSTGNCAQWSSTNVLTNTSVPCGTATFAYPFTLGTTYNTSIQGTTTPIWLQGSPVSLFASSTIVFQNATSTGEAQGTDTVNNFVGRISPTHRLSLQTGTTTTWTASTTGTAYSPFVVAPFTGTVKQIYCLTDLTGLGVNVQINGSNATPSYFVASTTAGIVPFTAGNTFTRGQKILMNVGTTTTSTATTISCTLDITETP